MPSPICHLGTRVRVQLRQRRAASLVALLAGASTLGVLPAAAEVPELPFPLFGDRIGDEVADPVVGGARLATGGGYWVLAADGDVFARGDARRHGALAGLTRSDAVDVAATPSGKGYWITTDRGAVFAFGDAAFHGSMAGRRTGVEIVDVAATPSGAGYWLLAVDGTVFAFGDAVAHGEPATGLSEPATGMAGTPSGDGYWVADTDGAVRAFGDAPELGSLPQAASTVVGIAATPSGTGYWLAADDGGVAGFGDARVFASPVDATAGGPIAGIVGTATGGGYWLVAEDGRVLAFGDARTGGHPPPPPPPPPPPAPEPPTPAPAPVVATAPPVRPAAAAPTGSVWDRLAMCESSGNWAANTGNGFYGGLQFTLSSWRAVGGTGYPHDHPRAVQIEMGERLQARQGWGAWPHCSRKLGLR